MGQQLQLATYLQGENAHAAGTLGQNPVSRLHGVRYQSVKRIPGRDAGAAQCACLLEIERRRHGHQAVLVEASVLPERAVEATSQSGSQYGLGDAAAEVGLIEQGDHFVPGLEPSHLGADGFDQTGTVGTRHDVIAGREGVFPLEKPSLVSDLRLFYRSTGDGRGPTLGMMRSR